MFKKNVTPLPEGFLGSFGVISERLNANPLNEMRQPYIVVDTDNKVLGTASDEKGAKRIIASSERPPMSVPDKTKLKIVKSRRKQHIGMPLKEEEYSEMNETITPLSPTHVYRLASIFNDKPIGKPFKYKIDLRTGHGGQDWKALDSLRLDGYISYKESSSYPFITATVTVKKPFGINEEMDDVNPKALKKDFDDRKDQDIDNDGDVDKSDEYLHNRRKAVSKAMSEEILSKSGLFSEEEIEKISEAIRRTSEGCQRN